MVDKKKPKNERERPKEEFVRESSGIYISDDDLISLIEERVPRIIRDKPYLKDRFRELFSDVFVEKRDIDKVLEEMRMEREASEMRFREMMEKTDKDREEANRKFEESDRKFREMMERMDREREEDRKRWEERMEKWEKEREEDRKRWEEDRKRWEERMERMDREREEDRRRWEERMEKWEKEREEDRKRWEEMREDTNRRFEEMREDTNKRFEAVDKRFEALTLEIKQLREDTNKRFEAADKRFEAITLEIKQLREDTNKRFEAVDKRFEIIEKRLEEQGEAIMILSKNVTDLQRTVGAIGRRWGMMAEDAFRNAFIEIVKKKLDIKDIGKWRVYDEEGFVYGHPSWIEADIAIKDSKHLLIEIKASASKGDIATFLRIGMLYEKIEGIRPFLSFLAVFIEEEDKKFAEELGVEVFTG